MPFVTVNQTRLFYRLQGAAELPVIVLSHSIGTDHSMWDLQAADLLSHFRVLRFDTRGHGASDVPAGEYSLETLGRDVLGLLDALGFSKISFCGLSMGGAIGQWLAVHAPERLSTLVLANTSPRLGSVQMWSDRISAVQKGGMAAIGEMAMGRFFSPETLARPNAQVENVRSVLLGTSPVGYTGCCAALRDFDGRAALGKIQVPTLVISGGRDVSTPWAGNSELLAQGIAGASSLRLPAAHLSNLERPKSFTAALFGFLLTRENPDVLQAGLTARRSVLGDAHVDRAMAAATDFTKDFQDLITRYAWGTIWTRPGLDHRTRRLLVLATMAALGRWEEFRMHVSAGLRHGLESCDIREVLLQAAVYAGVPAANTGFQIAKEEIERWAGALE